MFDQIADMVPDCYQVSTRTKYPELFNQQEGVIISMWEINNPTAELTGYKYKVSCVNTQTELYNGAFDTERDAISKLIELATNLETDSEQLSNTAREIKA